MPTSRHRPNLSLNAKLFEAQHDLGHLDKSSTRTNSRPSSASAAQESAYKDNLDRLRSFVRVKGSIATSDRSHDTIGSPIEILAASQSEKAVTDTGPLLKHGLTGGARAGLTLDRHIQYQVEPTATAAWNHHNCAPAIPTNPFSPNSSRRNLFEGAEGRLAVPRSLLCFSLELEPYTDENGTWPNENFEFVSVQLDFKTGSAIRHSRHLHTLSSPGVSRSVASTLFLNADSYRPQVLSGLPIVRGFAPNDLVSTDFLQNFGPQMYQGLHEKGTPEQAILLGSGSQGVLYRDFERRMARIPKPMTVEGDKMTARGCQAMASACPTPASSTFTRATTPFGSPHIESAEYGTSSIRIMVKRETESSSSWTKRKFPFVILLEHPPDTPSIEARVRLDTITIRKSVSVTPGRRPMRMMSFEGLRNPSWRSAHSGYEEIDPGYESGTGQGTFSSQGSRVSTLHSRSMSETSVRTNSGRNVEELEQTVIIYPRRDPVSVISCGLGTVKDTLFHSGMAPRAHLSGPPASAKNRSTPRIIPPPKTPATPRFDKPLPTPRAEDLELSKAAPPLPPRPPTRPSHMHSQSAQIIASSCQNFSSLEKSRQYGSFTGSEGSASFYSQESAALSRCLVSVVSAYDEAARPLVSERARPLGSRQASVGSSWTAFAKPSPAEPVPLLSGGRPRLVSA